MGVSSARRAARGPHGLGGMRKQAKWSRRDIREGVQLKRELRVGQIRKGL